MDETWKEIEGYENLYQVSNFGRVYSKIRKKILKPHIVSSGYVGVALCKNSERKDLLVHRLVAQAFIPNPNNLPCVNHKDEKKQNNCVDNLEWCSFAYNIDYNDGRKRRSEKLINGKNCKPILQYSKDGVLIKEWISGREIENELGYKQASISACCKGNKYRHTAYGYIWKYKEPQAS